MRPGGLTALAIFNFVFGGLSGIINLIGLATIGLQVKALQENSKITGDPVPSESTLYFVAIMALVRAALLITSGVGYLGLKRFSGRMIGNSYAMLAFVGIAIEISMLRQMFTIFNLVDFVYPLITLFLLNIIFRKDFK